MRRLFGIKLTDDERRLIEQAAEREGRPASNLARHIILTTLRDQQNERPAKAEALSINRP